MGPLINFLVLMVLLFAGLAQTHSLPPKVGYGIAIPLAVATFILAIIRYSRAKKQ
ncbi:MAG TPA: hypothetical protein VLW85_18120 [Myxococcales bacterium]|nr:hypothetical protein [Myxococcales bacterium]